MSKITLSPQAAQDIQQTWAFIAKDNIDAADKWQQQISDVLQLLAKMPQIGRVRSEFSIELRSFVKAKHVIFYQPTADGINVFRILHHSRDSEAIIQEQLSEDTETES
ncbi:MAG: type II toxin-antitoxin system RelE/ParE family toxin [Xenococcaceae cyanobacterium]